MDENANMPCRRTTEREPVTLAGSAYGLGRSRSIIVSDLSLEGARLHARDMPAPGQDVLLLVGPFDGMATVVWRSDDRCGVEFDEPLPDYMVCAMKNQAKWMEVAGWYR
jgi:PilZ domain